MPGFIFTAEIVGVMLRTHTSNLVVAIISKVIGHMLG